MAQIPDKIKTWQMVQPTTFNKETKESTPGVLQKTEIPVPALKPGEVLVEVGAGESPVEWFGGAVVAVLECCQALLDSGQVGEVVGGAYFPVDDGEVDLDLVEPGGVHGGVDHDRIRVAVAEPVDRGGAAV